MANHTLPFKKLDDEKNEKEKLLAKKRQKQAQRKLGYLPCAEWEKREDKKLSKITTKGVVKLFNSIYQFRKKIKDDKEKAGKFIDYLYFDYFILLYSFIYFY